jgi:amidophosphoribosyltransferase
MSGVFGVSRTKKQDVAKLAYYAAFALQHRGQETCGIAVNDQGVFKTYKDVGLATDVLDKEALRRLGEGQMAIGQNLYGTKIQVNRFNAQPMTINHIKGTMALGLDGAIVNAARLRKELELKGVIFHSVSEAEILSGQLIQARLHAASMEDAVLETMAKLQGAYSFVSMTPQKLIGVRDPYGVRPLCIGKLDDGYVISSESCAVVAVGGEFVRDVRPGEVVVIEDGELTSYTDYCNDESKALCSFEYIYFARPDSVVEGNGIHETRMNLGKLLAKAHPVDADVVIGVPDSGLNAAMGYATESGIPYGIGFLKNKYIGRSFIAPEMEERELLVRIKLNAISSTVKDKRVVVVDDSIVRGVTSARFIRILREAGAKEIHVRSSAPPFIDECFYGTDIDSPETLISRHHSEEEIARMIGADSVAFLPVEELEKAVQSPCPGLCDACFTAHYPIDPSPAKEPMAKQVLQRLHDGD